MMNFQNGCPVTIEQRVLIQSVANPRKDIAKKSWITLPDCREKVFHVKIQSLITINDWPSYDLPSFPEWSTLIGFYSYLVCLIVLGLGIAYTVSELWHYLAK